MVGDDGDQAKHAAAITTADDTTIEIDFFTGAVCHEGGRLQNKFAKYSLLIVGGVKESPLASCFGVWWARRHLTAERLIIRVGVFADPIDEMTDFIGSAAIPPVLAKNCANAKPYVRECIAPSERFVWQQERLNLFSSLRDFTANSLELFGVHPRTIVVQIAARA